MHSHAGSEEWSGISVLSHGSLYLEHLLVDSGNSCWPAGFGNTRDLPFFEVLLDLAARDLIAYVENLHVAEICKISATS